MCSSHAKISFLYLSILKIKKKTSVEFLPFSFHVKDLYTGAILFHGCTKDDGYEWWTKPSTFIIAFSSVKASHSDWHHSFGLPFESIFWHLVSKYKLRLAYALSSSFHCNNCYCNKSHKLPFSQFTLVSFAPL